MFSERAGARYASHVPQEFRSRARSGQRWASVWRIPPLIKILWDASGDFKLNNC